MPAVLSRRHFAAALASLPLWRLARAAPAGAPALLAAPAGAVGAATHFAAPADPAPDRLPDSAADTWRALSRLGYGPTPALLAEVQRAGGARAWALQQIALADAASQRPAFTGDALPLMAAPLSELIARERDLREARRTLRDDPSAPATVPGAMANPASPAASASARATPREARARARQEEPALRFHREVAEQAAIWRLQACSRPDREAPLLARMTEFWFNHFNVFIGKGVVRPFVGHYLLHAIRPHALGRLEDLVLATARHPAMLLYLDQARSVAEGSARGTRGLNENYARELLELHTLGVDGGYTQRDVRELARVLTGWTVDPAAPNGFRFAPRLHDTGRKELLGQVFDNAGEHEGIAAIRLLARHPATARRVARRLAQWFVADAPPPALVDALAHTFTTSGGDTRALLRTLVQSAAFWQAEHTLYKTPLDYTCSALAAMGGPQDERDVRQALALLSASGQGMNAWATPDGYATDRATWLAPESLTRRADFALALAHRQRHGSMLDWLTPLVTPETRTRIAAQPEQMHAGLLLASPDFMRK